MLEQALRCGVTVEEFWRMTPRETYMVIDAYFWRYNQQHKHDMSIAWLTAALTRAERLPRLAVLLLDKKAKKLTGKELVKRREEFKEMTQSVDLTKLKRKK